MSHAKNNHHQLKGEKQKHMPDSWANIDLLVKKKQVFLIVNSTAQKQC